MARSLRRTVVAVVALAIGFGVVTASGEASAAPAAKHVTSTTTTVTTAQPRALDWWW